LFCFDIGWLLDHYYLSFVYLNSFSLYFYYSILKLTVKFNWNRSTHNWLTLVHIKNRHNYVACNILFKSIMKKTKHVSCRIYS
jgi:hypothetical protein